MDHKPDCKLIGTDGNVFAIIGAVKKALRKAGQADKAEEFGKRAMASDSYDKVLALTFEYVNPK